MTWLRPAAGGLEACLTIRPSCLRQPLMATMKIVCDRVPALMPLGHRLGGTAKDAAKETDDASAAA